MRKCTRQHRHCCRASARPLENGARGHGREVDCLLPASRGCIFPSSSKKRRDIDELFSSIDTLRGAGEMMSEIRSMPPFRNAEQKRFAVRDVSAQYVYFGAVIAARRARLALFMRGFSIWMTKLYGTKLPLR